MKTSRTGRAAARISGPRWLAYATAGAATTFASSTSLVASIFYSGPLDAEFPPRENTLKTFQLDQAGDSFRFYHSRKGFDGFHISGLAGAGFRGPPAVDHYYVSRLNSGDKVSVGHFTQGGDQSGTLILGATFPVSFQQWQRPGVGYVGFRFDSGRGTQYGWARLQVVGPRKRNAFRLIDYAYADPGGTIYAGQTSDDGATPMLGSLGLLATGAAGLLVWRKSRRAA